MKIPRFTLKQLFCFVTLVPVAIVLLRRPAVEFWHHWDPQIFWSPFYVYYWLFDWNWPYRSSLTSKLDTLHPEVMEAAANLVALFSGAISSFAIFLVAAVIIILLVRGIFAYPLPEKD